MWLFVCSSHFMSLYPQNETERGGPLILVQKERERGKISGMYAYVLINIAIAAICQVLSPKNRLMENVTLIQLERIKGGSFFNACIVTSHAGFASSQCSTRWCPPRNYTTCADIVRGDDFGGILILGNPPPFGSENWGQPTHRWFPESDQLTLDDPVDDRQETPQCAVELPPINWEMRSTLQDNDDKGVYSSHCAYIYTYMYVCIYIYIYTYIHTYTTYTLYI